MAAKGKPVKLKAELIDGTSLITETAVEGFQSLLVDDSVRRVATWDTERAARDGHARLTREYTANIAGSVSQRETAVLIRQPSSVTLATQLPTTKEPAPNGAPSLP